MPLFNRHRRQPAGTLPGIAPGNASWGFLSEAIP